MKRSSPIRATLFNRDPNQVAYKGHKGMTVSVVRDGEDKAQEVWEWTMKYFSPKDRVNGIFETMRMDVLKAEGWQNVTDSTLGMWVLIEKNGMKFGPVANSIKL